MKIPLWVILAVVGFFVLFSYQIGSIAHWFYYTMMVIFSKMVFALMFGLVAFAILALIYLLLRKNATDK